MDRVLIHEHFSMFGLPNQTQSDDEFVNPLWKELFQELKIINTKTPPHTTHLPILLRDGIGP